jgi:hypothetical protein
MTERAVTIDTVQGIGDLFWCYQKLAPYFDRIHLRILCERNDEVQHRARPFCRMLPKVGSIDYVLVKPGVYGKVSSGTFPMGDVIRKAGLAGSQPYAVNAPLERGVHLRDIDPGLVVLDRVELHGVPKDPPPREDFLCLFVAGAKTGDQWSAVRWAMAAAQLAKRLGTGTVRLIGANWDKRQQAEIPPHLRPLTVHNHIGATSVAEAVDIIRRSRFLFGYQSGLNVLAENYDVPQLMVYFNRLAPMRYTWVKPASIRTTFHAMTFGEAPAEVIAGLPSSLFEPAEVTP